MLPYISNDMAEYGQLFDSLVKTFREVFMWIENVVSALFSFNVFARANLCQFEVHLSDDNELLAQVTDSLPGGVISEVMPFILVVLNLNVRTEAHRDKWDKNLCLVLCVGNFSGGSLMLKEQGLVFELQNGYFAIFRSSESTHFNLNYTGRRATFVMQTDIEFDKWVEGKNNWGHSNFFL